MRIAPTGIPILVAIVGITLASGNSSTGSKRPRPHAELAWTVDLRPLGFYVNEGGPSAFTANRQIGFGSDRELAVMSDRQAFPPNPNPARAFALDSETGKVVGRAEWDSSDWPYLFPTEGGRYVVNTHPGLRLYSAGLAENLKSHELAANNASPDGRAVTTWGGVPGRAVTTFLDADELKPTGAEFINVEVDSVAYNRIVYTAYVDRSVNASAIIDDAEKKYPRYDCDCKEVRPRFVSQDVLAVFGCEQMRVVDVQGEVLFTRPISRSNDWLVSTSRNGRRFAVIEGCGHPSPGCKERVQVYDVPSKSLLLEVKVHGGGPSGTALSPNGHLLAVNTRGIVKVFRLSSESSD